MSYSEAVADRDRARGVATQLEGQLAEVLRLVGERFGNHRPHRPGVDATVWERQNAGRCMRCADMWPCSSSLFLKQINAVTQVTGWLEQRAQVAPSVGGIELEQKVTAARLDTVRSLLNLVQSERAIIWDSYFTSDQLDTIEFFLRDAFVGWGMP